jgi:hypothetical protein
MKKPPLLTKEELKMVKEAILFPVMLDVIQNDIEKIKKVNLKLDLLLIISFQNIQDQIFNDNRALKYQLKERGIKIYEQRRTSLGIEAEYKCRGYQHHLSLLWSVISADILKKAGHYMNITLEEGVTP